jgi:hypothetical protein
VATSNAGADDAERRLRLLAESLIASPSPDGLADLEACADALATAGVLDPDAVRGVVVATVDALAVRGVGWLEPLVAELDVGALRAAVGASARARLRRVIPGTGDVIAVDVWDDRTEARLVDRPPMLVQDVAELGIDAAGGRAASPVEVRAVVASVGRCGDALVAAAVGDAHRAAATDGDALDELNRIRRRLVVGGEALSVDLVARFDRAIAPISSAGSSSLLDVVPLALEAGERWLLSIERWTDHWRLAVAGAAGDRWTALAGDGSRFGGVELGDGLVRFDPGLPSDWASLLLCDGRTEVDVTRP